MSAADRFAPLVNCRAIDLDRVPDLPIDDFVRAVARGCEDGLRVAAYFGDFGADGGRGDGARLYAVLADDAASLLRVARSSVSGESFPSIASECPAVQLFEREIHEQLGLVPEGHPWRKPVRFHAPYVARGGGAPLPEIGVADFYRVEGAEVHEVAVGPVHAGVIEPGHFRFQCHGEEVFHLEISLGYQHRGVERAVLGGPTKRTIHWMETVAGDTSVGHALAYCHALEAFADWQKPARAQSLRAVALELERMANHVGDLGALATDVGFLPTSSYCGRIRGDFLNMTALLCGSRFGRGFIRPGGAGFDVDADRVGELQKRLSAAETDTAVAVELLWNTPSVMGRFEDTGPVPSEIAESLGLVGPAARACGLRRDVRHDQPWGLFRFAQIPVSTWHTGDVFARAYVRWLEVQKSIAFIREQLASIPPGAVRVDLAAPRPRQLAVSLIEGWRGEICHAAITDEAGRLSRYKIVDPSFHNWTGLAYALRSQPISDFPLCNKSFNLSYCGHDL